MSATTLMATERLIDSVWTVVYQIVEEGKVKILSYDRNNPEGYKQERELPRMSMKEDGKRVVTHLRIDSDPGYFDYWCQNDKGELYEVVNPQYVFSYGEYGKKPENAVEGAVDGIPCGGLK